MGYKVSEDLVGASPIKIHEENCSFAKEKENTETMNWHGPMSLEVAKTLAECLSTKYKYEWKTAECCISKSR